MVSLSLFQYQAEVKRALLARKDELNQEWDPFVASWLAYAFVREAGATSLLAREMFERLETWSQEEAAWQLRRNVAPLLFLIWLKTQFNRPASRAFVTKATRALWNLNPDDKFSPWRYPEQVFLISLGISTRGKKTQSRFVRTLSTQMKGSLGRQMLLAAALKEVGEAPVLLSLSTADPTDVIVVLWWAERYRESVDRTYWWSQFASIADTLLFQKPEAFDTRRVISEWELVLLYEALIGQTSEPEPIMLFDYYPLHPRVRQIAEEDFKRENYFGAVFEACKALEDYLKRVSGSSRIGVGLVEDVLGKPDMSSRNFSAPRVKVNPLDTTSTDFVSQLDEQKGFSSMTMGVFQAFRNPKGHQPKDKNWVGIDAYEALDQLVVISLVMKRLQDATGIVP